MLKPKKIPMRMCVGCQQMKPKKELLRIVRGSDNSICIDPTGKKNGRGAYICRNTECLNKAQKGKRLERTFGQPVENEVYALLEEQIKDCDAHMNMGDR